jgi:glutaredoxin
MQSEPVQVYRRSWCEDSDAAVEYFQSKGIAYTEIDIEEVEAAGNGVKFLTGGHHITPTLLYRMQAIVFDPWDAERFERWWQLANEREGDS